MQDQEKKITNDWLTSIINQLEQARDLFSNKSATIGFDGFIDQIVKPIRTKAAAVAPGEKQGADTYFSTMDDFGSHIIARQGKSCSIELAEVETKIGGNMPNTANALGSLGFEVNCLGMMGYPEIDGIFRDNMPDNCRLFSLGEPGYSTALEFKDGKVMLAELSSIERADWQEVKQVLTLEEMAPLLAGAECLGLVNWGEMAHSNSIWEGVVQEVLSTLPPDRDKFIMFDLADFSRKDRREAGKLLAIMADFSQYRRTVLSLNENEIQLIAELLPDKIGEEADTEDAMEDVYHQLAVDVLVIHTSKYALARHSQGTCRVETAHVTEPELLTGGGDNFNAGFCLGQLLEMDYAHSLLLGNAVSNYYIRQGESPTREQLINFLPVFGQCING